ncbi:MAG TPA: hypothetical protein DER60_10675 [Syntrophomonas sp.]|nr:hypothetical protein [Syntrophomonas sp.]
MTKNSLKILLISPLPPPAGGIASWTKQYIEWSNNHDLNIDIVNTAVIGKRAEIINSKTKISDELKRTKDIIRELKKKIIEVKPQIIHLNTPCGKLGIIRDYLCARIAKKHDVKLFIHYRCNISDQVRKSRISRYFLKKIANIADINLVLNTSSKEYLKSEANSCSIKIANFIDKTFILQGSKQISDKIKTISFVGHIQRTKGIFEIIDVARGFPEITFKLAGPIANEIKEIDKPSNLVFMGPLIKQEVRELLIDSDIFLFPSYTEGFANAMLEAMSVGLPIISTPVGANIDMIESMGGVIVEVGDSLSIIDAIEKMKNSNDRSKMSEWNLNKVKSEYTTENGMSKLISLYLKEVDK